MAHRFINLQNELGKPVIAAGTKKPTSQKDFIDISWLNTTDENGEKVVVDTTLEKVRADLDKTFTDTTLNVLNEMDSRVKEVESTIDNKIGTVKSELQEDINQTAVTNLNETLKIVSEAKGELSGEIKKVQNEINDTSVIVLNTLQPQIDTVKKGLDSTRLDIASVTSVLKDTREALKYAVIFEDRIINTTNGLYALSKGEKFISAVYNGEGFIPTVKISNGATTLQFNDGGVELENVQITVAKTVDFYNVGFIPPVQEEVKTGETK